MAGTWADLTKQPGASVDTMLLLTDGTVIAHVSDSPKWRQLTPDDKGSYTTGTWSDLTPMPPNDAIPASTGGPTYGPLFFASAVLGDGTVLVAGGEYNTGVQPAADVAAATRFDPVTSTWTNVTTPAGWTNVGDAPLCVLADGRVLIGNINTSQTAFFDPATGTFSAGPNKSDQCSEESFVLLPDGTVLAVDCTAIPNAEKYLPSSNEWVSAGTTPSTLPQACPNIVAEIGPTVMLPDGNALTIGATGDTAIYVPPANPSDPGTWQPGPTITDGSGNTLHPIDAPAVLLPNGRVLLAASPAPPCNFPGPTSFFEYDPAANSLTAVSPPPSNASDACFTGRFLLLPNGQVLFSNQSSKVTVYTPDGTPDPSWKPAITGAPAFMAVGHHYALTGTQFNGLSQACMYGDDATMATNYPVARLEHGTTVIYCRTAHHSTMGVATGTGPVSTVLSIPPAVPPGSYDLVVVANGIPADPVPVTISATLPAIAVNIADSGDFGTVCGPAFLDLEVFNVGDADLIVDSVQALSGSGDFAVLPLPAPPMTIGSGGSVKFTVAFSPSAAGVTETGTVRVTSNDPNTPLLDIPVTATAGTGVLVTAIADQGDFGAVCCGSFRDEPLTLANSGSCPLTITAITSSSAAFQPPSVLNFPLSIAAGTAVELLIRFAPAGPGPSAASITVDSSDLAGPHVIDVSGRAPTGKLAVTGSSYFGEVDCGAAERTISVCNVGECVLHVSSVAFSRERRHFTLVNNPFPATLVPGSCLGVVIRYQASCEPECCELVITSDDPDEPVRTLDVVAYTRCRSACDHERSRGCGCGCEGRRHHDTD
jgi:hypothetical protein